MRTQTDGIRVLHVDDEPALAETAAQFLEWADDRIEVVTATDTDEGRERLAAEEIDCVVSDYDMPAENGIRFLERIRTEHPALPFILFTGKGSEEVASRAISAGVTDYLQKETGTDQYEILANRITNAVERNRAERTAERRERQLRTVLDNLPYPAYVVDSDLTFRVSNESHARFHGMTVAEVEGTPAGEILDDATLESFSADCAEVLETGEPASFEGISLTDATGKRRVFNVRMIPMESAWAPEATVLGVAVDVTDLRENQRELRERNRQLEAVLDTAPAGIFLKRPDGRYLRFNETAREWTGIDPDRDITALSDVDIFPEDVVEEVRAGDERVFAAGEPVEFEEELPLPGGPETVLTRKRPVYDDDGEPYAVCAVVTDITDYKRRERELRRYEAMVNAMRDATCIYDADGRFETVNDYLVDFYDTPREALIGRQSRLVEHVRESEPDCDPYEELVAGDREQCRGEYEGAIRGEGRDVIDYRLTRLTVDGEFEGVVGVGRDVSDRRERERRLERQNERLEAFTTTVSHDLRSPLTVARARIDLVREECDTEHADDVAESLDRMATIIEDLLDLARDGEVGLDPEPVSLASAVRTAWDSLEAGGATLRVDTDRTIQADRDKFQRLVENLLRNAVEHGSTSPPSTSSQEDAVEHGSTSPASQARRGPEETETGVTVTVGDSDGGFYVADDGPGVPPEERHRAFEPGYSTNPDGTGFGLQVVQRVAEVHGWTVELVESADGGARFEVIPAAGDGESG